MLLKLRQLKPITKTNLTFFALQPKMVDISVRRHPPFFSHYLMVIYVPADNDTVRFCIKNLRIILPFQKKSLSLPIINMVYDKRRKSKQMA